MNLKTIQTKKIKDKALELGFSAIGISRAGFLEKDSADLRNWLKNGFHGEMQYMENNFEKRTNPKKLVDGAKSVISVLLNYYPKEHQVKGSYKISKYAFGKDYHYVLKDKLTALLEFIQIEIGGADERTFVDSAPVLEKSWAEKSGLGWIGKNTNLISNKFGSFNFIGELIVNIDLDYDQSVKDSCGSCTKCIDSCPTGALSPYNLDARKCISYLTIEKKGELPPEMKGTWEGWIFGCDKCQDICPWNTKVKANKEPAFAPRQELLTYTKEDWQKLDKATFKRLFKNSAIERTKFEGLKRNIEFLEE